METEIIKEKYCENCRYFSRHYAPIGIKFKAINCGHCLNSSKNLKKQRQPGDICDHWEITLDKKEENKKSIIKTIELIHKRLDEIAVFLSNDHS